jgi:hypothetical protein
MADDNPLWFIKEIGGALKLGSGLLGKSAIALCIFLCILMVAVFRLHSDLAIFGALAMGAAVFFVWFFPVIRFAREHPAEAMLEGAEWSGYQRAQAAANGLPPDPLDRVPQFSPATVTPSLPEVRTEGDTSDGR